MLKSLLQGILSAIAVKVLDNYRHLSMQVLRIEAATSYVRGVRIARAGAIGAMRLGLVIALIAVGVVLFHVGLFLLLPWSVEVKAAAGMGLGLIYAVIGGVLLRAAMDERTWMAKSGAGAMVNDALREPNRD